MREPNPRLRTSREKFEISLDGRQVASIVVGALVILGVVFVLGLNVGKQLAARRGDAARAGDLEALDHVPAAPAPARRRGSARSSRWVRPPGAGRSRSCSSPAG